MGMMIEQELKKHRRWHAFTAHWHNDGSTKEPISGCAENEKQTVYWKHCCLCGEKQIDRPS